MRHILAAILAAALLAGCTTPTPDAPEAGADGADAGAPGDGAEAGPGDAGDDADAGTGDTNADGDADASGDVDRAAAHATIMAKAREVAEGIDTPEEAFAAGYRPDLFCVPGMGVHWLHAESFDTTLDPDMPEVVLFQPQTTNLTENRTQRFLGIEYVVVTQGTEHNTTETVPRLEGIPLYGPMEGHAPGMPWHAELHVFLAEGIESDESFPQEADVTCPDGTTPPIGL